MTIKRPNTYAEITEEFLTNLSNTLVGMTHKQAQSWADGEGFIVACDYNIHRIDLEQDKVVRVDVG